MTNSKYHLLNMGEWYEYGGIKYCVLEAATFTPEEGEDGEIFAQCLRKTDAPLYYTVSIENGSRKALDAFDIDTSATTGEAGVTVRFANYRYPPLESDFSGKIPPGA